MEQVLHAADAWDTPHALFEVGDFGDAVNFAAEDDGTVLAVDVQIALGHLPVAEQLALDPLTQGLIVGDVRGVRHQMHDAVRDAVRFSRRPTPRMLDASADAAHARRESIAQHVAAPSTALEIEEKHS
jgi:hypothetical protein